MSSQREGAGTTEDMQYLNPDGTPYTVRYLYSPAYLRHQRAKKKYDEQKQRINDEYAEKRLSIKGKSLNKDIEKQEVGQLWLWYCREIHKASRKFFGYDAPDVPPMKLLRIISKRYRVKEGSVWGTLSPIEGRDPSDKRRYENDEERWEWSGWYFEKMREIIAEEIVEIEKFNVRRGNVTKHRCLNPSCRNIFTTHKKTKKYCCPECRDEAEKQSFIDNRRKNNGTVPFEGALQKPGPRFCIMCGKKFDAKHSNALTCSDACRVARSRARKSSDVKKEHIKN